MAASEPGRSRDLTLGLIYGAVSVSIFASFVLISRIGMRTDLQAGDLLALRFGVGGIILLPVLLRYGCKMSDGLIPLGSRHSADSASQPWPMPESRARLRPTRRYFCTAHCL